MKSHPILLIVLCIAVASCRPSSPAEQLDRASKLFHKGKVDEALTVVNEVIIHDSLNMPAHELRGKILWQKRDTLHSKAEFDLVLSVSRPEEDQKIELEGLIDWEITHANQAAAKEYLERDLELFHDDPHKHLQVSKYAVEKFLEMGDSSAALGLLDTLIANHPERFPVAEYVFLQHLKLADTAAARRAAKASIRMGDGEGRIFKHLAILDFDQRKHHSAIRNWTRYLDKNEKDAEGWFSLGVCNMKLKHNGSAKTAFKRAMDLGHKDACSNYRELTAQTRYHVYSRCCDGSRSSSTGRGTCSHHGGVCRTEYQPYKVYTVNCR